MCVYNIHIYPILYVGDTLYIGMYIYDIWGIHCEKLMYTYDVKHTYTIYMYTHIPMMVMRVMILWSARGHTLRCSDGLYGEYAHV